MPFNSFSFWLVFPFVFLIFWCIPVRFQKIRKAWLIAVSYFLYMNWKPAFALVLLFVTAVTYFGARLLGQGKYRKSILGWTFGLLALMPLLVFKYYNFLNDSLTDVLSWLGLHFSLPGLNYAIPVGLSFFTFQALGYLLEVYRGETEPEKNWFDYMLFVSFFPQIASGPISKANELLPQIKQPRVFVFSEGKQGLKYLLWGLFIKVVIADRMGMFVDVVYADYTSYNGMTCFMASLFYTVQIYCDFAGYSLMAIGVASLLGFKLINNFRRPYFATSITDFWRRWHISLTRWLTQNIYIPLGGNRCSRMRCYFNIMITFLVSGAWHGAAWNFIFWGALHGGIQIAEKSLGLARYEGNSMPVKILRIIVTFMLVNLAWIFFRMPDMSDAFGMIGNFFSKPGGPDFSSYGGTNLLITVLALIVLIFKEIREEFFPNKLLFIDKRPVRWIAYLILFCMIFSLGVLDGGQFIYVGF
ncbi:MAG: MBOAT family protein [Bacteroidales bacterium]|nr:MBOAT family protein [Bacteroidales bacterium]